MNSLVEAKIGDWLRNWLHMGPYEVGTVLEYMRALARVRGFDLDERFAGAGLGGGPEANVAAGIVDRALLGGGGATSDYTIRQHTKEWLRKMPRKGRL